MQFCYQEFEVACKFKHGNIKLIVVNIFTNDNKRACMHACIYGAFKLLL